MDEAGLLRRAQALAGQTFGEVARAVGLPVPASTRRHKGWVGQLVERALGATAGSLPVPDFPDLAIEVKTLPVDARGRASETTFVASLDLGEPDALAWETSSVRKKLARVLWMPVEADPSRPLAERRVGWPWLWQPGLEETRALEEDFEALTELIVDGLVDQVTARTGKVLQLRPKGANAGTLRWTLADGGWARTPPRAFYLRRSFTQGLLDRWPAPAGPPAASGEGGPR